MTAGARLVLARHGDTFAPGDKIVWVGARSDPSLTTNGRDQALMIAAALRRRGFAPERVLCGPLRRTRESAEIIASNLGAAESVVDERLREIDYGAWEGRSSVELAAEFGEADILAYERGGLWPAASGWAPPRADMIAGVDALIGEAEAAGSPALFVTSNGVLRLFAERAANGASGAKMSTGNLSFLEIIGGVATILAWNLRPSEV